MTYSRFIAGFNSAGIEVDRKILADLAVTDAARARPPPPALACVVRTRILVVLHRFTDASRPSKRD